MKTITIRLPDVEAAMLIEVQRLRKEYRNIEKLVRSLIVDAYYWSDANERKPPL